MNNSTFVKKRSEKPPRNGSPSCFLFLIYGVMAMFSARTVWGTDRYWANTGTDFNDGASWMGGSAPGSGDRAFFATDIATQPSVSAPQSLYALCFTPALGTAASNATSACGGYTLSGATLTLTASGSNHSGVYALEQCTKGTNVIAANLAFPDSSTLTTRNFSLIAGTLELSGPLTGNASNVFRVAGGVTNVALILSGDNTGFTGGFMRSSPVPTYIVNKKALSKITRLEFTVHGANGAEYNAFVNQTGEPLIFENNPQVFLSGGDGLILKSDTLIDFGTNTVIFPDTGIGRRSCPLTIDAPLVRFGGAAIQTGIDNGYIKRGWGTLEVCGPSSYLAETIVADGVFLARHPEAFSPSNALCLTKSGTLGGVLGLGYGDFTNAIGTTAGCFYSKSSGGYSAVGGWAAYGTNRTVNVGGDFQTVTNVAPFFNHLILGASDSDATVTFQNPMCVGNMTFYCYKGAADISGRVTGTITNYNATSVTLSKYGDGTLELTATNPITGTMNVYTGKLLVSGAVGMAINVKTGGVLGGKGKLSGSVTIETNGTFAIDSRLGATTAEGNLTFNAGACMTIMLDGSHTPGIRFSGTAKTLKNLGAVTCTVFADKQDVGSGSLPVIDWTDAVTPTVTGLDATKFAITNTDFTGTFAIQGTQLVLTYRSTLQRGTVIYIN